MDVVVGKELMCKYAGLRGDVRVKAVEWLKGPPIIQRNFSRKVKSRASES